MKINKFILIFILLIIGLSNIYASGLCWATIICDKGETTTGSIISTDYVNNSDFKEEYCEIQGINIEGVNLFEIEIIQGQFEGGVKTIRIFVDEIFTSNYDRIHFVLSKATSPTYVLCHEIQPSSGATENPVRLGTRDFWTASYDQQWFKQNAGMPEYDSYENLKNWNQNQTYNNSDRNSLHTTNEETTTQKTNNDNRWYSFFALIISLITIVFIFKYIYKMGGPFKPASFILSAFIIGSLLVITNLNVFQIGILVIVLLGIGAGNLGKAFDKIKEVE